MADRKCVDCGQAQRLVLDIDCFSGIARSGQCLGYDQHDWLSDVPHLTERGEACRAAVCRHD
jgi:hypothetical protein